MNTPIKKQIQDDLHWLFSRSIFIKLGSQEISHMPVNEVTGLAFMRGISENELQHLLHILRLSITEHGTVTGFIDLAHLKEQLPAHFNKYKETDQVQELHKAVQTRDHLLDLSHSRFTFSNPYIICWMPESEANALEYA